MIDDDLVLRVERLRDSVESLRAAIRQRYRKPRSPVVREEIRGIAAQIGERWLVEVAVRDDVRVVLPEEILADLNIQFQRLITYSERTTVRIKYDAAISAILKDFRTNIIVPLKQSRGRELKIVEAEVSSRSRLSTGPIRSGTVFVAHSFSSVDKGVIDTIIRFLEAHGLQVITGEKPEADSVSSKVRQRIEHSELFLGVFTEREKLSASDEWVTSTWLIDEKAYALAKGKKLILLKEHRVQSIGGLQGDYEYLPFDRNNLADLLVRLLELLNGKTRTIPA